MKKKIVAPTMTYVEGSEFSKYVMQGGSDFGERFNGLIELCIEPYVDISAWQKHTLDPFKVDELGKDEQGNFVVINDIIASGLSTRVIFKEQSITTSLKQAKEWGLKHGKQGSPNNRMRNDWNLYVIERELIRIPGVNFGNIQGDVVLYRAAQGGDYQSVFTIVDKPGKVITMFEPSDGSTPYELHNLHVEGNTSVKTVPTPLTPIEQMWTHFFAGALEKGLLPYTFLKDTAIGEHAMFGELAERIFKASEAGKLSFHDQFLAQGLLTYSNNDPDENGELKNTLTDAATMAILQWKDGGYAGAGPNAEMDMIQDEAAQAHGSPALMTSVNVGYIDGDDIFMYDAAHGTGTAGYKKRKNGHAANFNPIGQFFGLLNAMDRSAMRAGNRDEMRGFTDVARLSTTEVIANGKATPDMDGSSTPEQFIHHISDSMAQKLA